MGKMETDAKEHEAASRCTNDTFGHAYSSLSHSE